MNYQFPPETMRRLQGLRAGVKTARILHNDGHPLSPCLTTMRAARAAAARAVAEYGRDHVHIHYSQIV